MMNGKMGKYEKKWFVVVIDGRKRNMVKRSLTTIIAHSVLRDSVFHVKNSSVKGLENFLFVEMLSTSEVISAVRRLPNVWKVLGSIKKSELSRFF